MFSGDGSFVTLLASLLSGRFDDTTDWLVIGAVIGQSIELGLKWLCWRLSRRL